MIHTPKKEHKFSKIKDRKYSFQITKQEPFGLFALAKKNDYKLTAEILTSKILAVNFQINIIDGN
jgi:hypothetical protein